jgi:hypothetical protein
VDDVTSDGEDEPAPWGGRTRGHDEAIQACEALAAATCRDDEHIPRGGMLIFKGTVRGL